MKALYTLSLALCLHLPLAAQTIPTPTSVNGKSELVYVVPATGSQDELFIRGKDWLFRTYNSGKTVEQFEDKAAGHITAKARTQPLTWKAGLGIVNDAGAFSYNLTLDFKEGKARLVIDNITYQKGELKNSMILKSGADLADDYPANWPTLGKKSMTEHWREMQVSASQELSLIAKSFEAAVVAKGRDF
jgi:hypothetical protein